jgi:hypothetical protein
MTRQEPRSDEKFYQAVGAVSKSRLTNNATGILPLTIAGRKTWNLDSLGD